MVEDNTTSEAQDYPQPPENSSFGEWVYPGGGYQWTMTRVG